MDKTSPGNGKPVLYYLALAIMLVAFFGVASQAHAENAEPQTQLVCE